MTRTPQINALPGMTPLGLPIAEPSFSNDYDALVFGLVLALTAPTNDQAKDAARLASEIAFSLSADQVDMAKAEALERSVAVITGEGR